MCVYKCVQMQLTAREISLGKMWCALKRALDWLSKLESLLGACVLGHGLGSLGHSVLGQFSGEEQTDCGLDFPGGDGGATVVVCQAGCLSSDTLEDVIHERVHDRHGLAGDSSVGVDLFQHFVNVDAVRLPPPLPALLLATTLGFRLASGLLRSLRRCCFWRHVDSFTK